MKQNFSHVSYLWDDSVADQLGPVERLRYRSNILGADQRITNTGGGNTSSKIKMTDPLSGEEVDVLWVKGSGGDLRTATRTNFASLYMDKFLSLEKIYYKADAQRCQKRDRRCDGGDVSPYYVWSKPSGQLDRHTPAWIGPLPACRPHAPGLRDCDCRQ